MLNVRSNCASSWVIRPSSIYKEQTRLNNMYITSVEACYYNQLTLFDQHVISQYMHPFYVSLEVTKKQKSYLTINEKRFKDYLVLLKINRHYLHTCSTTGKIAIERFNLSRSFRFLFISSQVEVYALRIRS